jgi:hypothetical protein
MKLYLLVINILFLIGCQEKNENNYSKIEQKLRKFIAQDTEVCLVIPREGCGGGISDATTFMIQNADKYKDIHIIFTGINDLKELKIKIGITFLNRKYVSIDSSNTLMESSIASIYPQLYFLKSNFIENVVRFEIGNEDLKKFKK